MSVSVTELHPKTSPKDFRVTTAFQHARQRLSFVLYDRDGKQLDISNTDMLEAGDPEARPVTDPDFDDGQLPKRIEDLEVRIIYRVESDQAPYAVVGKIDDAACGKVSFHFEPKDLKYSGIYQAQIQIGKKAGGPTNIGTTSEWYLFHTYPLFINVEHNIDAPYTHNTGITIPEVRMHLFDNDPAQNLTLGDHEFSDAEILSAALHAVDLWNEALPPIAPFTGSNFPFKAKWLDGTVAVLLTRIANRKRRNTLSYSAGGVNVDDQNYQIYEQMGQNKLQEYMSWVEQKKMSINMQRGFSSMGGIGF